MPALHTDITANSSGSAPSSWANVTSLSDAITLTGGASSLVICQAVVPIASPSDDDCADFQFALDGTREGPQVSAYADNGGENVDCSIIWVMSGWTGSKTVSLQWQVRSGKSADLNTSRIRSFQVIELLDSEANLLVSATSIASDTAPGTYANVSGLSGAASAQSTSSVLVMLGNMTNDDDSDTVADYMFADDGTREGPEVTLSWVDNDNEVSGGCVTWAKNPPDTSSHTYSLQWQARTASSTASTSLIRSFQVLELLNASLGINVTATSSGSSGETYADVTGMTGSITPDSSSSVIWMHLNMTLDMSVGSDESAFGRFSDGGTEEGGECIYIFCDSEGEGGSTGRQWAKTGITGSHTLSFEWRTASAAAATDTGRTRSFQVIDIKASVGGGGGSSIRHLSLLGVGI